MCKEQGKFGIKNGPVSKFNEFGKVAQQHFTCFRTLDTVVVIVMQGGSH